MTTALQPAQAPRDIRSLIISDKVKAQIRLALPVHMSPDRMMRVALTAINKTPKLLDCTQESILSCLMQCSQYGVEPDGRHAHLIPYGNQCTLIIDYKGIVALVRRSGEVNDIYADVVCENDRFEFQKGRDRKLTHSYDLRQPRGEVIGVYSYVVPKEGADSFEIMSVDEVEAIRARSRSGKAGPWVSDWNEMAKKTVFRRHSKWLPFSAELQEKINSDGDFELDVAPAPAPAKPVFDAPPSRNNNIAPMPDPPPPAPTPQTEDNVPMDPPLPTAPTPVPEPLPPAAEAPKKERKAKAAPAQASPMATLIEAGVSFDDFTDWCVSTARWIKAKDWPSYEDVPDAVWKALEYDRAGIAKCVTIFGKTPEPVAATPDPEAN